MEEENNENEKGTRKSGVALLLHRHLVERHQKGRLIMKKRTIRFSFVSLLLLTFGTALLFPQPKTRTEEIEQERREKLAVLWPERESPLVDTVNGMVEKGLLDGARSGEGKNGLQFIMVLLLQVAQIDVYCSDGYGYQHQWESHQHEVQEIDSVSRSFRKAGDNQIGTGTDQGAIATKAGPQCQ